MRNCLVAQSGGPTAVINSSMVGVIDEAIKIKHYDNIYIGLNGILGIINKNLKNFDKNNTALLNHLKYTPSSAAGSCRHKLAEFSASDSDYIKIFEALNEFHIKDFFYIGGNDSMDTVDKLNKYAVDHGIDINFIGVPKTIDNDLVLTDHCPGFGSAAKFIGTTVLETYLDSIVYGTKGVFLVEIMGRDTGWLAASTVAAKIKDKQVADLIYLPEVPFSLDNFVNDVDSLLAKKNFVYVVASEGIKDSNGKFISAAMPTGGHDKFGHVQLGGTGLCLKNHLKAAGINAKMKALELGVTQRASMHLASQTDIEEAFMVGQSAVHFASEGRTGIMAAIIRTGDMPYQMKIEPVQVSEVANKVKYFPKNWINSQGNNVTYEGFNYVVPLMEGQSSIPFSNGLPVYEAL